MTSNLRNNRVGGIPILPNLPSWLAMTQGNIYHVMPYSGSDSYTGLSVDSPLKTLARAQELVTANQNDVVLFYSENNDTSAYTTDYQSSTLTWAKDGVHLIGINSGTPIAARSRVAFTSSYDTASNLFTLSADNCYIANAHLFAGVAGTNPTGCMSVTGDRNRIENCHIAGIGNDNNDIADAYSLSLNAAHENLFVDCTIGLDTIARGTAANSGLVVAGQSARNTFRHCDFIAFVEHASNHVHVRLGAATSIDRWLKFDDCDFVYQSANYGAAATGVMNLAALTQGYVIVRNCTARSDASGTTIKWDVNDRDKIIVYGPATPAADTCNVGRLV